VIILEKAMRGVRQAELASFARRAQRLAGITGAVDVLIAGNGRLRELNRRFRGKNKPTDVLSFPRDDGGDIAISGEIARENAARYGHGAAAELKILILHGMLHLAGHDHENDSGEMARVEDQLRTQLKLPSSLIERANGAGSKKPQSRRAR
jgi:probable rRNA maturation factor